MIPPLRFLVGRKAKFTPETGQFPCPACGVDQEYLLIVSQETYGIIDRFLPGLHGRVIETRVQCQTCDGQFPGELRDKTLYRDRQAEQDLIKRQHDHLRDP